MKNAPYLFILLIVTGCLFTSCQKEISTSDPAREADMLKKNDKAVIWTRTVQLRGTEEVPSVTTPTNGVAIMRLTAGGVLHSKVNVDDIEPGDALRFAHIHYGAKGVNGGIFVFLVHNADGFGMNHQQQLTEAQVNILLNDPLYVNVHSNKYPTGIIRGQIR